MNNSRKNPKQKPASHDQPDFHLENNPLIEIKRTIAIISGKGGVGKSLVTGLLATYLARTGKYRVGILDADITGPSIPKLFGADDFKPRAMDAGLFPVRSHSDIQLMSINLFGESTSEAVARAWDIPYLGSLPIDPELAQLCDAGQIERVHQDYLPDAVAALERLASQPDRFIIEPDTSMKEGKSSMYRKIAIASEGKQVCEHFGHCEGFTIYDTDVVDSAIVATSYLPNPGHKPGLLPNMLNDKGVQVVIAGGMGGGAIDIFKEKGIDVITGASGQLDQVIDKYLAGSLVSSDSVCHEHQHADSCGEHT